MESSNPKDSCKSPTSGLSETFETENLSLAAYLMTIKGAKLKGLKRSDRTGRHLFVFEKDDVKKDAILDFFRSDFRKYSMGIQDLREMLRNFKEV
jgi:hypothetical protein